jgi:predicted DNA-binding transcriptional regulator AlpA
MQPDLEALAAEFLGPRYAGRRFLRYRELRELGLVGNRATLDLWMDKGAFPRGLKLPGPYGKTLVWHVPELVRLIAQRLAERDASPRNEEGAPAMGRPVDSDDGPLAAGREEGIRSCLLPPPLD